MACVAAVALVACGCASTAPPAPRIFWAQSRHGAGAERGTIARANLDGSARNAQFIIGTVGGGGVAVDGRHIYWANYGGGTIGRADLDGSNVERRFITGAEEPVGVAVDGRYIYWTDLFGIGRANLDGTGANPRFFDLGVFPVALAIDDRYVYWADLNDDVIGRANLDGTHIKYRFITGANAPDALTIDAHHIYWSNSGDDTIGRANVDGSVVNQHCIILTNVPIGNVPEGLALDGDHIYWANYPGDTIGRANLDGSTPNERFIIVRAVPEGIAIIGNDHHHRPALAADADCAPSHARIVLLGSKARGGYAVGWGEAAPPTISLGGASASGTISAVHWNSWGGSVASGRGLNPIFAPQGGYYRRPAIVELRASRPRRCGPNGSFVYTRLISREQSKRGGPIGKWSTGWGQDLPLTLGCRAAAKR